MNKISSCIYNKNLIPKKMIIGSMVAGSLLCTGITSCSNKVDYFEKGQLEYLEKNKNNDIISDYKTSSGGKKKGLVTNLEFISEKDSPLKKAGKRITVGLLAGVLGGLISALNGAKKTSKHAAIGAAAGALFPGLTLTVIFTAFSSIAGALSGTFLSGGNEKIGKIAAAVLGFLTAAACIL